MLLWVLTACGPDRPYPFAEPPPEGPVATEEASFEPGPPLLRRLTQAQWRASVRDLLGVEPPSVLPPDLFVAGFSNVGASQATLTPVELEQVEAASWDAARLALPPDLSLDGVLGCGASDLTCRRAWLSALAERAWRRPVSGEEVDRLLGVEEAVKAAHLDDHTALQAAVAAVLQAPDFLFVVELGEATPTGRQLTQHELAARLALVLWDSVPDPLLRMRADAGELSGEVLREEIERLLADPRSEAAWRRFFREWTNLDRLRTADKDPDLFPDMNPELREVMIQEAEQLFVDFALSDRSLGELFKTAQGYADPALGALYGVSVAGGLQPIVLPAADQRGGLLGRAALLTLNAHATMTSPTLRGKFVRSRLLCQDVPPPPPGVIASLDEASGEGSLRDRLAQHANDPACSGCHDLMDPIGFALERFDPIGRWRADDQGYPLDLGASVDGVAIEGAADLGRVVAEHPNFPACVARQLYRHVQGRDELTTDAPEIEQLGVFFQDSGLSFRDLVVEMLTRPSFVQLGPLVGDPCANEGEVEACATDCGRGERVCQDGSWTPCSAPEPRPETCEGTDQDCDGAIDEDLVRPCETAFGPGLETCADGVWTCAPPPPEPERCNGEDDDQDGAVDEDLTAFLHNITADALQLAHGDCDPYGSGLSGACFAASHRSCAATGCAATGTGPLASALGQVDLLCLAPSEVVVQVVSYSTLSARHPGCHSGTRVGPDCNAAIHRYCSEIGQETGFGPIENYAEEATIACVPGGVVQRELYSVLAGYGLGCDGVALRSGPACSAAFQRRCVELGFAGGFGPVENSGDDAYLVCVGGPR